jgi:hypothetical protein
MEYIFSKMEIKRASGLAAWLSARPAEKPFKFGRPISVVPSSGRRGGARHDAHHAARFTRLEPGLFFALPSLRFGYDETSPWIFLN